MANVCDVAKYILEKQGSITSMKLQKLMYYSQAWSLVWDEESLFDEDFEAWANGPVLRSLFNIHRGKFKVSSSDFATDNSANLSESQRDTIDAVLVGYGNLSGQELSQLTHSEDPWKKARNGLSDLIPSDNKISLADMDEYYSTLKHV